MTQVVFVGSADAFGSGGRRQTCIGLSRDDQLTPAWVRAFWYGPKPRTWLGKGSMKYRQAFGKAVLAVSALLAIPAAAQASSGSPAPAVKPGTDKVIIVLRSQFAGLPDTPAGAARRRAAVAASQRGVLAELAATHARGVKSISLVNAVAATVSPVVASRLAADPAVAEVVPDQRFSYGSAAPAMGPPAAARPVKPLPGACPVRKNAVQLNPEAVEAIHAATQSGQGDSAQALGYTGSGVKVAFIADRADPDNPDFIRANGRTGLPTLAAAMVAANKPITADLTITNSSALSQQYFVDARRSGQVSLVLAPQVSAKLKLPDLNGDVPTFLVPSGTTGLSAKVIASARNFFDLSWAFGDPDVISSAGKTSTAAISARQVPNGDWVVTPYLVGPDGKKPTKPVRAHVTMRALTAPFDPTITSPTGDLWLRSTNKKAALAPLLIKPGQKITIPVRIDPKGAPGRVVSGTIYVSSVSFNPGNLAYNFLFGELEDFFPTASKVAAFHYAYTIAAQ